MSTKGFRDAGHAPSLLAALIHFDVSFMCWVLLGALGAYVAEDLGLSPAMKGLVVAVPPLGGAAFRLLLGPLSDRVGIKRLGQCTLAVTAVPLLWGWLAADSLAAVLGVGLLLGVAGASFAIALPLASRWYPPEHQGLALGIAGAGNSGTVIAALAAPRIAEHVGWHGTFGVALVPVAVAWVAFTALAKEPPRGPGGTRRGGSLGLLRETDPRWLCAFYLVTFGGFVGLSGYLAIFFVDGYGLTKVSAGGYAALCAVAGSLLRPVGGALADRHGGTRVLAAVLGVVAILAGGLAASPSLGPTVALLAVLLGLLGMGNGAVFQLVGRRVPERVGAMTGLVGAAGGVGGFLLPFGFGALASATGGFAAGFTALALAAGTMAVAAASRERARLDEAATGAGGGVMAGPAAEPTVLVVGGGMVGHRVLEAAVERGLHRSHRLVLVAEERHPAYDRVHLSSLFDGASPADLVLAGEGWYEQHGIELRLGDPVRSIDTGARTATTEQGTTVAWDACVLATGSAAFVPPIPGSNAPGAFPYRTIDDLEAIGEWAGGCRRGVVVGGGLLGLEAANALRLLGLAVTVVEFAPRLMAVQLDEGGGAALRRHVEGLGIAVRTGAAATEVVLGGDGATAGLRFTEGEDLVADIVVFAAGIRPRDQLAHDAGLAIGERGGVVVDDGCETSVPGVFAVGEVACHGGRTYGLVAPGHQMADVVVDRIAGGGATFAGADLSTRLKLLGVEVASVGDPHAAADGLDEVVVADPSTGRWQKAIVDGAGRLVGAVLVGDARPFGALVGALRSGSPLADPLSVLAGPSGGGPVGPAADGDLVCTCHNVTGGVLRGAVREGAEDVPAMKACTKAGTGCGSCVPLLQELIDGELAAAGKAVVRRLCPHFALTRAELFDIVRVTGIRTFGELVERHGTGRGCEICRPAVASMLASLDGGYVLDGERAALQDTNDHFLANLQKDGTYSVVPRIPGGEITPEKLIVIGEVARDFGLYTKITGGQRIDLLGARVEQLPAIWERLVAAGFESGHAYGKAVRTVKSCVGSVWCRYGVQDSVQLAIDLELRYRGLRAPHKIKLAVSGCARECAEAQSKDVGVIATERGWNLYVGGNGGMRPAHAQLLAEDLDTEALVRLVDRYLMYYIRTADRLERTATWQRKLAGGLQQVRRVVVDDALGIAAELEADMARVVGAYRCEWAETLSDPDRLARFTSFVNTDAPDPTIARVAIRGQLVPAAGGAR